MDEGARTVSSWHLVELVLERLREIDKLSYDRLAINYIAEDGQLRPREAPGADGDDSQLGLFRQRSKDESP